MRRIPALSVVAALALAFASTPARAQGRGATHGTGPGIASLKLISIDGLRAREFSSALAIEQQLGDTTCSTPYSQFYGSPCYNTYMASYRSDGLRVYTRIDIPPTPMPADGYPVIVFAHGWVGASGAPAYPFQYKKNAYYGDEIDAWVKAGYVVLVPGFRGHGTVKGVPAEGLDYIKAYDNGSYLSPIFYAIDILNLLEGTGSLNQVDWRPWGYGANAPRVNTSRVFLTGHSQGGDAALTALAVSSGPRMRTRFAAASIFNGCFEGRIEQGAFYGPQENSYTAKSDPAYYPYMPYWWDDSWYWTTTEDALARKKTSMYDTVRTWVANERSADPATDSLVPVMATLDAFKMPQYVTVPLDLHYSDWDYYSIPAWNATLVRGIRATGGTAVAYEYFGNTHELTVDPYAICNGACVDGRQTAIQRTIARFDSVH